MLHGFMGTAESHFLNQISFFEEDFELILLDLPGHGNSEVKATENYFMDTVEWVIDQMKIKGEGYILGLSLGASLAIHIAQMEPTLVRGIILTGYSPYIPKNLEVTMENQYHYFMNIEKNDKEVTNHFKVVHGEKWFDTLSKVLYTMTFHYPLVTKEELNNLKVPTLVLNGSKDSHEVKASAYIKTYNNNVSIGVIPNAGHTANMDQPKIFNIMMKGFIENQSN